MYGLKKCDENVKTTSNDGHCALNMNEILEIPFIQNEMFPSNCAVVYEFNNFHGNTPETFFRFCAPKFNTSMRASITHVRSILNRLRDDLNDFSLTIKVPKL